MQSLPMQNLPQLYWKDLESADGQWEALLIEVSNANKPRMRLETGNNNRLRLRMGEQVLFWAAIERHAAGVWLLRNNETLNMPIPPISSSDTNIRRHLQGNKFWSRFFAKQLAESENSLLYNGKWLLLNTTIISKSSDRSINLQSSFKGRNCFDRFTLDLANIFEKKDILHINWFSSSTEIIALKQIDEYSGRLKFWRKQVREGIFPPVLIWYASGLDAYIIIDGHYRLAAAQLENKNIEIMILKSYKEIDKSWDESSAAMIMNNLQNIKAKPGRQAISVQEKNNLLIAAYDNRAFFDNRIHSWACISNEEWRTQIYTQLAKIGSQNQYEDILNINI